MSEQEFITFQKFESQEEAEILITLLQEAGIAVQYETVSTPVDVTFTGNAQPAEVLVKIHPDDFESANETLEQQAKTIVVEYPDDHYIFSFTDDELLEIVQKADEWSKEDYLLSMKILKERGKEVSDAQLEVYRQERLAELRREVRGNPGWVLFGFVVAILGGLLGIIMGWIYYTHKKTDSTGHRFFAYDAATRKKGRTMYIMGIVFFICWMVWIFRENLNLD